jgi:hypothetical protein
MGAAAAGAMQSEADAGEQTPPRFAIPFPLFHCPCRFLSASLPPLALATTGAAGRSTAAVAGLAIDTVAAVAGRSVLTVADLAVMSPTDPPEIAGVPPNVATLVSPVPLPSPGVPLKDANLSFPDPLLPSPVKEKLLLR